MPAIPAITYHSHVTLDAAPFRLDAETYLLMQRARVTANSGNSQRFVDLAGNCFLRVDSDQRLQFSIDFFVAQNLGLADYYPGRALSARGIAFATGTDQRHQFATGGIFIYESATDDDGPGELRSGSVVISYDLHTGLDTTTYPTTGGGDYDSSTYADVPVQTNPTEISNACKELLLKDIFYAESNLDQTFQILAYDGDPAGVGTLKGTTSSTEYWTSTTQMGAASARQRYAVPPSAITFAAAGSTWNITHLRLARGANVICDIALDAARSVASGAVLRIPAGAIKVSLTWHPSNDITFDATEVPDDQNPCIWFLGYVLGGTRAIHLPELTLLVQLYTTAPGVTPGVIPLDTFAVGANSATWLVSGRVVTPIGTISGVNAAPEGGWTYSTIVVRLTGLNIAVINMVAATTYQAVGVVYASTSEPSIDIDG